MADKKISELVSLAGKDVAATDFFPVVDVSVAETKSLTRDELRNAVNAIHFTATKALATLAAASLPDDTIIEVAADESLSGDRTRYKVVAGALVFAYGVVTKADLADTSDPAKGAALVGFLPAGTGAVPTTVQTELRNRGLNILNFGENTIPGVTDMSPALISARTAAAGRKIYIPGGHYKFNQVISSSEDLVIEGDGSATILDFTGSVTGGGYGLEATGTAIQIEELSGTQTSGTNTVTFLSPPSLIAGDVFVIYNPTDSSWSGFRTVYRAGEWCEVASVSGNVVTVRNQLYDTYTAANVDVYKISGPKVVLRDFEIRGTTVTGLIKATLCISPLIENVSGIHANNSIVYFDRCFGPTVTNPNMSNVGDGGDDYGISVGNSQHARVNGGYIYSRRHAISTGGDANICCVPVRDARFIGCTIKNDIESNVFSADFHGNTEDSSYINCTIYGGATWQGKDVEYINCTITADKGGRVLIASEIKGGKFALRRCKLITNVDPALTSRGIVNVGNNEESITANTVLASTFIIEDCTVYGRNLSATATYLMMIRNSGATAKINVLIDGVVADVDALVGVLRTNLTTGTADSDFIVIDRISNFPSGVFLHVPNGSHYLNFPHRCQRQSGSTSITATSGTNTTLMEVTSFKYKYPRPPVGSISTSGIGTVYNGNRPILPNIYSLTASAIRPVISTGDAVSWLSTSTVTIGWMVGLDEV